jgi:hypothetical protein
MKGLRVEFANLHGWGSATTDIANTAKEDLLEAWLMSEQPAVLGVAETHF